MYVQAQPWPAHYRLTPLSSGCGQRDDVEYVRRRLVHNYIAPHLSWRRTTGRAANGSSMNWTLMLQLSVSPPLNSVAAPRPMHPFAAIRRWPCQAPGAYDEIRFVHGSRHVMLGCHALFCRHSAIVSCEFAHCVVLESVAFFSRRSGRRPGFRVRGLSDWAGGRP